MMSIETIRQMAADATRKAARAKKQPYVPYDAAEVEGWDSFPFAFVGDYVPRGWKLVDTWFCDSSGFGADDEPALSVSQLKEKILVKLDEKETFGYAITQAGQFQVYVGVYQKLEPRAKKARASK